MFEDLDTDAPTCDAEDCDRQLPAEPALVFERTQLARRAYECACGAITITVVRESTR